MNIYRVYLAAMVGGVGNILPFEEPEEEDEPIPGTPQRQYTSQPNTGVTPGATTHRPTRTTTKGLILGGLPWDEIGTTAMPEFECKNYTKEEKKEIKKKIVERRPKPPTGRCSIPTVAGLKREAPCDPEFDEDCEDDTPYSFCCSDGCEVIMMMLLIGLHTVHNKIICIQVF